jgi:peptidoglycan/LPS O-acetylase OafA/YrhL
MDATVLHNDSTLAGALVNTQARVPALDGVRGMAIVLVLSFHWIFAALPGWHSADLTISEAVIRRLTMLNWAGVDLFFVLSGFVIGAIILDNRDAGNFLRVFLPLYTPVVAVMLLGGAFISSRRCARSTMVSIRDLYAEHG